MFFIISLIITFTRLSFSADPAPLANQFDTALIHEFDSGTKEVPPRIKLRPTWNQILASSLFSTPLSEWSSSTEQFVKPLKTSEFLHHTAATGMMIANEVIAEVTEGQTVGQADEARKKTEFFQAFGDNPLLQQWTLEWVALQFLNRKTQCEALQNGLRALWILSGGRAPLGTEREASVAVLYQIYAIKDDACPNRLGTNWGLPEFRQKVIRYTPRHPGFVRHFSTTRTAETALGMATYSQNSIKFKSKDGTTYRSNRIIDQWANRAR